MPIPKLIIPTPSTVVTDPTSEAKLILSGLIEFFRLFQKESPREDFSHLVGGKARPAEEAINIFKVKGNASLYLSFCISFVYKCAYCFLLSLQRDATNMALAFELVRLRA